MPYDKLPKEEALLKKRLPEAKNEAILEKWAKGLLGTREEFRVKELLEEYQKLVHRLLREDLESFDCIVDLIEKAWLTYLYPEVYANCIGTLQNNI